MKRTLYSCSFFILVGCAPRASVNGTVTYDGQPVKGGNIVYAAVDGQEEDHQIGRATITAEGRYQIRNLVPGQKRVQIAAHRIMLPFSEATEHLPRPAPDFPDDAEGNGQVVDLNPGDNKVDIVLKKPAKQPDNKE